MSVFLVQVLLFERVKSLKCRFVDRAGLDIHVIHEPLRDPLQAVHYTKLGYALFDIVEKLARRYPLLWRCP